MSDIVFIEQLTVNAILGILPEERITPQPVVVDLQLQVDSRAAAQSTRIEDTLDYADLANKVQTLIIDGKYLLIETQSTTSQTCVWCTELPGVTVEVRKPKALANAVVGLRIYRAK